MTANTQTQSAESSDEYADISEFDFEPLMQKVKTHGGFNHGEEITAVYDAVTGELLSVATLVNSRLELADCDKKTVSVSTSSPFVSYQDLREQVEYNLYPERFGM